MNSIVFNGKTYNDDRMFVLYLCKCTIETNGDLLKTTIYHEQAPEDYKWCIVTYRNTERYSSVRVDHFDSRDAAQTYLEEVEPTVPLISLEGNSPRVTLPYNQFIKWKAKNELKEYNYKEMYSSGVTNPMEFIITQRN